MHTINHFEHVKYTHPDEAHAHPAAHHPAPAPHRSAHQPESADVVIRLPDLEKTIRPKIGKFSLSLHQAQSIDVEIASQTLRSTMRTARRLVSLFTYDQPESAACQVLALPDLKKTIRPKIGKFIYLHQPVYRCCLDSQHLEKTHQAKDW